MASMDMPRLIAWVARVCRSWWGWMCASPAAAPARLIILVTAVAVEGSAVLPGQQQRVPGRDVLGSVGVDDLHEAWVQRQVAVLVELADRHVEPVGVADEHDGVGGQGRVLPDPQPGAQEELDGDSDEHPAVGLRGAQQLGRGRVVQGLGQGVLLAGHVTEEHRHPGWGLVPAPLVDPHEEHSQGAEAVGDGGWRDAVLVLARAGRRPTS